LEAEMVLTAEAAIPLPHPSAESPGRCSDICFRVTTHAKREQLQELASQVLIGLLLLAAGAVEPNEHGWVGENIREQRRKITESMAAKQKPNENLAREFLELFTLGVGRYTE